MTVKELHDLLKQYPDNAEVFVIQEREPGKLAGKMADISLSWVVDQDTNKGCLCLYPKA